MSTLQRSTASPKTNRGNRILKLTTALVALALAATALAAPASAESREVDRVELGVGLFYGTFNETGTNTVLLVGGRAEDFCNATEEGGDPFDAEPGKAPGKIVTLSDGTVKITTKDRGQRQPIHLYEISGDFQGSPDWIGQVCDKYTECTPAPEPFASGTVKLKSRVTIHPDGVTDVFNSVKGKATGTDGARYKVRASADFVVTADGELVGSPPDFVKFSLKPIGG